MQRIRSLIQKALRRPAIQPTDDEIFVNLYVPEAFNMTFAEAFDLAICRSNEATDQFLFSLTN